MALNKFSKTAIIVAIYYILPLLWNPLRIIHLQILILMIGCAVLYLTQPEISLKEGKEKAATDKNSYYALLIFGSLSQIITVVEWGYFRNPLLTPDKWPFVALGFLLLVGGLLFRVWSIQVLGHAFTAAVEEVEEQELITSGPYRFVRHPSYLGAYLAIVGAAIFLQAIFGFIFAAFTMFLAYKMRVSAEEEMLANKFGQKWQEFCQKVPKKVFPFIW